MRGLTESCHLAFRVVAYHCFSTCIFWPILRGMVPQLWDRLGFCGTHPLKTNAQSCRTTNVWGSWNYTEAKPLPSHSSVGLICTALILFNFSYSEAALMACSHRVTLTDDPLTIDAIHWAENEVDANIEASMKNTGESMISILSSCHWQLIQFWLFYSSDWLPVCPCCMP